MSSVCSKLAYVSTINLISSLAASAILISFNSFAPAAPAKLVPPSYGRPSMNAILEPSSSGAYDVKSVLNVSIKSPNLLA